MRLPDTIIAKCPYDGGRFGMDSGKNEKCYNQKFTCMLCKRCYVDGDEARRRLPYIMLSSNKIYNEEEDGEIMDYIRNQIIKERIVYFLCDMQRAVYMENYKSI